MSKKRLHAYGFLLSAILIWGAAGPVIKLTLEGIDPIPFLAYRFMISGIISVFYFLIARPKIKKPIRTISLAATHGALGYVIALLALFYGLQEAEILDLSVMVILRPLIIMIAGAIFFHDRITHREKLGAAIAAGGTALVIFYPAIMNNEAEFSANLILIIFLIADVAALLFAKEFVKKKMPPMILAQVGLLSAGVAFFTIAMLTIGLREFIDIIINLPFRYHLGVFYMAIFSGTIAYYFLIRGQKSIEVSEAGLFFYLDPIVTVPLAVFWLGEKITAVYIAGAMIIAVGVVIAEYKGKRAKGLTK